MINVEDDECGGWWMCIDLTCKPHSEVFVLISLTCWRKANLLGQNMLCEGCAVPLIDIVWPRTLCKLWMCMETVVSVGAILIHVTNIFAGLINLLWPPKCPWFFFFFFFFFCANSKLRWSCFWSSLSHCWLIFVTVWKSRWSKFWTVLIDWYAWLYGFLDGANFEQF